MSRLVLPAPVTVRMEGTRTGQPPADGTPASESEPAVSVEPGPGRLFADLPVAGEWRSLARHRATYRMPPPASSRPNGRLIELVGRAGLQGRGGAGFPTARKLAAVAGGSDRRVVIANATEGEPASGKDRLLVTRLPHLVLDGALLAAHAVGAGEIVVCVDRTSGEAARALRRALAERREQEPPSCDVRIALTPPRYVAGEETALVHWLNGGPAKPTLTPPRPFERGVDRRPTLVQNVETLAHLSQIATFGHDWFRQAGTAEEPGTALFTVSGVARPIVLEAEMGARGGDVLAAAAAPAGERLQAIVVGGYFGTWMSAKDLEGTPLSRSALAPFGASPGAGILVTLPESACGLLETARILRWYAGESAGQCGPCTFGLPALAKTTSSLAAGRAHSEDVGRLHRWAGEIEGRGACRHPDGAVRLLRSALSVFASDVEAHLRGRPCEGSRRPALQVPASSEEWR
ncbi:MAG: NADH-ubiquinone oxidoreductase-F iron-sulfur binding region domain-containing protein [Acidimicrobiales bacterium]|jgi:NADH:ubiquinone oxidoreductase subunit F (NADH-binding)